MATVQNRLPQESSSGRPYLAGIVTIVAGLEIVLLNWQIALDLVFIGGAFTSVGLILGTLIGLTGGMMIAFPHLARPIGVVTVALSVLALLGALGGFLFGTILGIAGGSLAIAWESGGAPQPRSEPEPQRAGTPAGAAGGTSGSDFSWQEGAGAGATGATTSSTTSTTAVGDETPAWEQEETPDPEPRPGAGVDEGGDDEPLADFSPGSGTDEGGVDFSWQDDPGANRSPNTGVSGTDFGTSDSTTQSTPAWEEDTGATEESWGEEDEEETWDESDSSEPSFSWQEDPHTDTSDKKENG